MRLRTVKRAVVGVTTIVVAGLAASGLGLLPRPGDFFGTSTEDRSKPVVLREIKDLNRFVGATGTFDVVVEIETKAEHLPSFIYGVKVLFVATGSVDSYVDFAAVGTDAVTVSADRKSVTVKLPEPALTKPNIDHEKSSIFSEKRGLVNFVGDMFNEDPNRAQRLNKMAEEKILAAADASELKTNAKGNISKMLVQLLSSLGFSRADVVFG